LVEPLVHIYTCICVHLGPETGNWPRIGTDWMIALLLVHLPLPHTNSKMCIKPFTLNGMFACPSHLFLVLLNSQQHFNFRRYVIT
jgi:hypothetical protein